MSFSACGFFNELAPYRPLIHALNFFKFGYEFAELSLFESWSPPLPHHPCHADRLCLTQCSFYM
jgi:hypothetical protein